MDILNFLEVNKFRLTTISICIERTGALISLTSVVLTAENKSGDARDLVTMTRCHDRGVTQRDSVTGTIQGGPLWSHTQCHQPRHTTRACIHHKHAHHRKREIS